MKLAARDLNVDVRAATVNDMPLLLTFIMKFMRELAVKNNCARFESAV